MDKSFVINRNDSWLINGSFSKFYIDNDRIKTENADAFYNSFALDSTEDDMTWQRIRIKTNLPMDTRISVRIYTSDSIEAPHEAILFFEQVMGKYAENTTLDGLISELTPEYSNKMMALISDQVYDNTTDILLYGFKGRYFWFSISLHSYGEEYTEIESVIIEFPRIAFINYLPQIYRGENDSFMARFIAIFQSVYMDIEQEITDMPMRFDPHTTDTEFLNWIASWFAINDQYIWKRSSLRELISNIMHLYKYKGTKSSIKEIVKLFLGIEPVIIERFEITDNEFYKNNRQTMDNLFGDNDYVFTMFIKSEFLETQTSFLELLKVVNRFKPIEMICNPVILENKIYLDQHCYLGMNAVLYESQAMVLDDKHSLSGMIIYDDGGSYE